MDNLNHGNESDAIREKANALKEMVMQNAESSATGGGHLPPMRKKRGERKTHAIFEKAVTRSRMTADEYRAALVAEAEAKAKEEARLAAEAKAKEEAMAMEALKRQAEAEAKAQAEEIERLKAQAEADAAAREEELARVRAEAEEEAKRQAEEAARIAREEAEEAARKAREEAMEAEKTPDIAEQADDESESFEAVDDIFDNSEEESAELTPSDDQIETEVPDEDVYDLDNASLEPVHDDESVAFDEEKPVFDEDEPPVPQESTPVFEEEKPVFEESAPVFDEEKPVFEEEDVVEFEEETVFEEETPIFEEQEMEQSDDDTIYADDADSADQANATEPDDFGFAIDTMTKSEAATELKYDHAAFRTHRKHHEPVKTTNIPWVIPGNVQDNTVSEETQESVSEPQVVEEVAGPEESPAVQAPIEAESRSEREERDVLSLLDEYEEKGEAVFEKESVVDTKVETDQLQESAPDSADQGELEDKVDELFEIGDEIDTKDDLKEELVSSEALNADAVSANTLFETEEMVEKSPAKDDFKDDDLFETETVDDASSKPAVESTAIKSDERFEETLFTEMKDLPESNDDLFETESIDTLDDQTSTREETKPADDVFEKEDIVSDDAKAGEAAASAAAPAESFDDLFEEEAITDKPSVDDTDRFDTKPIADKVSALFDEDSASDKQDDLFTEEIVDETVEEKQDDLKTEAPEAVEKPAVEEEPKATESPAAEKPTVPMLDELFDLDDHIADPTPVDNKKAAPALEKKEAPKPIEKPKTDVSDDDVELEMVDLDNLTVNRVVDNGAGDTRTPSEILTDDDADKIEAVDLSAPQAKPVQKVNIDQLNSLDDLFSVETVPEKVEPKVKTVTEKIVPGKTADDDALFETETITPGSRTAPLPNLDPKATTPLEKQDMSAQSKVSKAFDALFEEDEA
ncbi:MAG: hypothetical protein IJH61_01870 [Eubacteriaceae bacterium]|nr:hypothetical protein [Eubacteriaceae bacterium]